MTPPTPAPITPWLQHLSQLMPATGVLLVGAGAETVNPYGDGQAAGRICELLHGL